MKTSLSQRIFCAVSVWIIVSFMQFTAFARVEKVGNDKTLAPYFFIENGDPSVDRLPLKETNTVINISGVIAEVTITQVYQNNGERPINARYIFPASTRAAVHDMKMIIGEHVIRAEMMKRQAAKKKFEAAKKKGKSASLLEQQRPNVFSMNIANIIPGDTIKVELSYTEFLVPTEGIYEFVFPTVVGPRYSNQPESSASEYDQWVKNPYFKEESQTGSDSSSAPLPPRCNITTHISTGVPLQEITIQTHQTNISWKNSSEATITLNEPEEDSGNRDYILKYRLAGEEISSGLMLYKGQKENFFLLMVQPPRRVESAYIPAREYIFLVDVSGSMHGFPIDTAKELLRDLIRNLRPEDKFNVILFAGSASTMSPVSIPANRENIQKAIAVIDHQRGGGGTEMLRAVKQAMALPRDEACSRSIVIVTDGYVSFEKSVFHHIRGNLGNANVFAFGIGGSVNRYLIEGMARAGYGEPFVVTNPKEAPAMAAKFRRYIQSPVLTNISVTYDDFDVYQVEPLSFPDLLADRPIVIFGKWRGAVKGSITLRGLSGNGKYEQRFPISEAQPSKTNHSIRYLWARTRIANLSDFNFNGSEEERAAEITLLGLTYNLLTKYTSFIAVHEVIRNPGGNSTDVKQPLPLPLRVSNYAVGGGIANGSEPEMVVLLVLFSLFLLFYLLRKRVITGRSR
jgi:Ca-activated chloride channel family protein